jgi:hypothetical protein
MRKSTPDEKIKFFVKVIIAHIITYIGCGLIAFNLLNYGDFTDILGFKPMEEISLAMILLGQAARGILFGFVLWWIRDSIIGKKLGWLKLWGILIILGIINTYGPAQGSIEGFIYLDLVQYESAPASGMLSLLEITLQPLLFSLIVTYQRKKE